MRQFVSLSIEEPNGIDGGYLVACKLKSARRKPMPARFQQREFLAVRLDGFEGFKAGCTVVAREVKGQ
jgi:hypothetical protein